MSNPTIVVDVGSTHMRKLEYMREMIQRYADCGVDVVKIQLFNTAHTLGGNLEFPREWFQEMWDYAHQKNIGFTASVFDKEAFDLVATYPIPFVKLAFSQQDSPFIQTAIHMGHKVVCSYDIMSVHKAPKGVTRLYVVTFNGCVLYPVPFKVDFSGIAERFDGFSSHCMGITQEIEAVMNGARFLEVHGKLEHKDINVPDSFFAKSPREIEQLVKRVKR